MSSTTCPRPPTLTYSFADIGKRRNRTTQSCLNCHTSKRMVGSVFILRCIALMVYILYSVIASVLVVAALNSAW